MRRILVLRGGALGDLIVTLPALQALRLKWPAAHIELVGNATAAALAVANGLINHVESQHAAPWHQLFRRNLDANFHQRLSSYNGVISFWPDADGDLAQLFPLHKEQIYISASAQPTTFPAARHFNGCVQALTGLPCPDWIRLQPNRPATATIALHPGSGSRRKNWPIDRWLELAHWLRRATDQHPVFILGEVERTLAMPAGFAQWRELPLLDLATRLSACRLFIGHDSGISHLAAACCRRGLLLFGPTNQRIWAPPNPEFRVLSSGTDLTALTMDQVMCEIEAMLADQR